jgi:hypothetical protein
MGFVLHLSLRVASAERAGQISRQFLRLMDGVFPEVDTAFSSISAEDDQNARVYLFCGQRINGDQMRCLLSPGHHDTHSPQWSTYPTLPKEDVG